MREKLQGRAEELALLLIPKFGGGCRRLTPGIGYLEAPGKESVEVVYGEIARIPRRMSVSVR